MKARSSATPFASPLVPLFPLLALFALPLTPSSTSADPLPKLTIERINSEPPLSGTLPSRLQWHPDGKRLTFLRRSGETSSLHALDVTTGQTSLLLDGTKLMMPGEKAKALPLAAASWLPNGRTLLVPAAGDVFAVDVATAAVRALVQTPETEEYAEASPDGTRVAFVRKSDLWVVDVATGRQTRLSQSGSDTLLNGKLDWVYEEELASRSGQAYLWSPDSRAIAYLQLDQSRVPTFPIVDFLPVRNDVQWQRYPEAGAPNAIVRVGVIGLAKDGSPGPERLLSFTPDDVYVLPQLGWTPDSRQVAFQHLNRAQNELELRLLPVAPSPGEPLGTPRTVLTERSKTFLNTFGPPRFLKDARRFLWLSERDGFAHVYVCDLDGRLSGGHAGSLGGGRPGVVHGRRPRAGAGRAHRLSLFHRQREGRPRAAPLPRAPRRHGTHPPDPRGRDAPDRGVPRRPLLRGHLVGRRHAPQGLGQQPGRHEAPHPRGERAPAPPRLRARQPRVGRREGAATERPCTPPW